MTLKRLGQVICLFQLILLRLTVDLLKRLSKTNNAVFNGRVLMWLAFVLPLSERSGAVIGCVNNTACVCLPGGSGLNLKSEANTANVTVYEESIEQKLLDSVEGMQRHCVCVLAIHVVHNKGTTVDPALYKAFWSLQNYIHNPSLLFKGEHWTAFAKAMESVLSAFSALPVAEGGKGTDELCFTTKYLTSSRLLKLQVEPFGVATHSLLVTPLSSSKILHSGGTS